MLIMQTVPLKQTFHPLCFGYFGEFLENYLPVLASNHDPPNLSLPSSEDYRPELPTSE
jgi:hypothetical protein